MCSVCVVCVYILVRFRFFSGLFVSKFFAQETEESCVLLGQWESMGSKETWPRISSPAMYVQDSDYSLVCNFSEVFGRDGLDRQLRFSGSIFDSSPGMEPPCACVTAWFFLIAEMIYDWFGAAANSLIYCNQGRLWSDSHPTFSCVLLSTFLILFTNKQVLSRWIQKTS